MQNKRLSHSI